MAERSHAGRFFCFAKMELLEPTICHTSATAQRYSTVMRNAPIVLTIAGFDPSSGAGVTADIKTLAAHGCYGIACITAMTVQSTRGVRRVEPLPASLVSSTLKELVGDFEISALKVGMLGSGPVARAVLRFLGQHRPKHSVLDPVLRSSSGTALIDAAGVRVLPKLFAAVEVITPNVHEASVLSGVKIRGMEDLAEAAAVLHQRGARNVVITGGDFESVHGKAIDVLSTAGGAQMQEFAGSKLASRSTHGTGCAFSTAVAANLALGRSLPEAVSRAKHFVREGIRTAETMGQGVGPMNHFPR